jgi:chemotaxis methyl-accepting protein methylase
MRNRPTLELIRRLVERSPQADILRVAVLGCSTGPEAYSVAWRIRSARPDLKLILHGVDISQQALELAQNGVYSLATLQFAGTDTFDHLAETEIEELFDLTRKRTYLQSNRGSKKGLGGASAMSAIRKSFPHWGPKIS